MLTVAPVGKKQPPQPSDGNANNKDIQGITDGTMLDQPVECQQLGTFASSPGGGRNDASNIIGHVHIGKSAHKEGNSTSRSPKSYH